MIEERVMQGLFRFPVPMIVMGLYAAGMLVQARQAGPSCFLGQCAYGDRLAEMAALAIAIVAAGMLAAAKPRGWSITAWSVGAAAAIFGSASIQLPEVPGSLGQTAGALTVAWGILFVTVAAREARTTAEPPSAETRGAGRWKQLGSWLR